MNLYISHPLTLAGARNDACPEARFFSHASLKRRRAVGQEAPPRWNSRRATACPWGNAAKRLDRGVVRAGDIYVNMDLYLPIYVYIGLTLDKKLRLAGTAAELRLAPGGTPPKDWIVGWFEQVIYICITYIDR